MLLILLHNTCLSCSQIQVLASHDIGDTCLKRGNYAHVKDVTPLRQVSLSTTTDDHHMSRGNGSFNDLGTCYMKSSRINRKRNFYGYRHGWLNHLQVLENP